MLGAGCGGPATLRLKDGTELKGDLTDSHAARRAVQMRFSNGKTRWIELDTVSRATRPGAVLMALGGGSLGFGMISLLARSGSKRSGPSPNTDGLYGIVALVAAPAFFIAGFTTWSGADYQLEQAGWKD